MTQESPWGQPSKQQHGARQVLTPISTSSTSQSTVRASASSSASLQNSKSAAASASHPFPQPPGHRAPSRASSVSSNPPSFPTSAAQQSASNQLLAGARSRAIASSNNPSSTSSAAGLSASSQGAAAANSGGGGGTAKVARASPSLSLSSGVGSPIGSSNLNSTPGANQALAKIVIAQVFLLLSGLKDDRDKPRFDQQAEQLRKLIDAHGMDVFSKYFRRLLQQNAAQVFPGSGRADTHGSYGILVGELQKIRADIQQADKIAESISATEGEFSRDFDLSTFIDHFKLDIYAKIALASAFKRVAKGDLKTKADAILSNSLKTFFATLSNPNREEEDVSTTYLAALLERIGRDPPRNWNEETKTHLHYALTSRYEALKRPPSPTVRSALIAMDLAQESDVLVRALLESGPSGTASLESSKELVSKLDAQTFSASQIAKALVFLITTVQAPQYKPVHLVGAIRESRVGSSVDWKEVVASLDRAGLSVTKEQFLSIYESLLPVAQHNDNFDIQQLWGGTWNHIDTQLSFVVAFLSCTPEELDASRIPRLRAAFSTDQFKDCSDEVRTYAEKAVRHPLVSLDATAALFNMIFRSQDTYNHAQELRIPEIIINPNTDLFLVAASKVPKPWTLLQDQAIRQLFWPFLRRQLPNYGFVLNGLWMNDSTWIVERLIDLYAQNAAFVSLFFDQAQEQGWLEALTSMQNELGADIVVYAHAQGTFDITSWFERMVKQSPDNFPKALYQFTLAKANTFIEAHREKLQFAIEMSVKTVYEILTFLERYVEDDDMAPLERICVSAYPRLVNYGEGNDDLLDENGKDGNAIGPETDAKMQEHFKNMYSGESDVRDIIEALQRYKNSSEPADQDLFACMIHGLLDEYNCFGQYPMEALATTAVLFGGIINFKLLGHIALQTALSMVYESVRDFTRQDPMFKFGLQAMIQFTKRLPEWPSFCERLLRIPDLQGTEVWTVAQQVVGDSRGADLNGEQNGIATLANGDADKYSQPSLREFGSLQVDPPTRSDFAEPDDDTQEKVLFFLNNVTESNLDEKISELAVLQEKHVQWFASYVVAERAKLQPNFHRLYLDVLGSLNDKTLWAEVLRETYVTSFRLLNSESTLRDQTEKIHLKNIASWLGLITIARDKPIKFKNISFKDLLSEAYDTQRLVIVIPFTCAVLVQAASSTIFRPPNPWLMEVVRVLVELYHFAELKLNLKFEIEVLCRKLELDHKVIEPSSFIRTRPLDQESFLDMAETAELPSDGLALIGLNRVGANERFSQTAIAASIPDFSSQLVYPPSSSRLVGEPRLRQIFQTASQTAVAEIIAPVVERSVTIASIAAAQLVTKDYATEPSEDRFREAAYNTVKALSGSLALVTCKEPLRVSITNNIRMMARDLPEQALPEGLILMFVNDNLDTICNIIEQAAETQSINEIDNQIEDAVRVRQVHQSSRMGEAFMHPQLSRWAMVIPDPYKPMQGGLNREQLAVYEDFARHARGIPSHGPSAAQDAPRQLQEAIQDQFPAVPNLPTPAEAPAVPQQTASQQTATPQQPSVLAQQQVNGFMPPDLYQRMQELFNNLHRAIKEASEGHASDLGPQSPVRAHYQQLLQFIETSGGPREPVHDILAVPVAQRISQLLFEDVSRLEIEVFVQLLSHLAKISEHAARMVYTWLFNFDEKRVLVAPVTICLFNSGLLSAERVDGLVAKALKQRSPQAVHFMHELVDDVVIRENLSALRTDFTQSFEALAQWAVTDPDFDAARGVLSKAAAHLPADVETPPTPRTTDDYEAIFENWIHLQQVGAPERVLATFVYQLYKKKVIDVQEHSIEFFRVCIDMSLETLLDPMANKEEPNFLFVDSFATLILCLGTHHGGDDSRSGASFLDAALSLVCLICSAHEGAQRERWNPAFWFRFFKTTLDQIQDVSKRPERYAFACDALISVGKSLLFLQPHRHPSFATSWLALIGYKEFMPAMLTMASGGYSDRWNVYASLVESGLEFVGALVKPAEASGARRLYYGAVLRILLVLHHDFPEFLAENHYRLCNAIPVHCVQLRNLVVSAYPSSFPELPDPFTAGLKVDRLEEIKKAPVVRGDFETPLVKAGILGSIKSLLESLDQSPEQVKQVISVLNGKEEQDSSNTFGYPDLTVDPTVIHAVVLFIAVAALDSSGGRTAFHAQSPHAKLFETITKQAHYSTRYYLISAIVNQLRYPNSHTHWFSYLLLHLFGFPNNASTSSEAEAANLAGIQEQITRVLLERLLVHRPHPWGLIITLLEILKNPSYGFWELPFVKGSGEIEQLFGTLFRHIESPRTV